MILTFILSKNPTASGTNGLKYASDLALQRKEDLSHDGRGRLQDHST